MFATTARVSARASAAARSLHSQAHAANAATASTPAKPATVATSAGNLSAADSAALHLYVWGGGQVSLRARTQTSTVGFVKKLFGKSSAAESPAAAAASGSNSPLHKLTLRPTEVASPDGSGFRDVNFGHTHGAIVTGKGNLYTYGSGLQLGHGKEGFVGQPKLVTGVDRVVQVACGKSHTLVLTESGEVFACGKGDTFLPGTAGFALAKRFPMTTSAIGSTDRSDALYPRRVALPSGVRIAQISAGSTHSLLRSAEGQVFAFGSGEHGRLGTGSSQSAQLPVLLQALQRHRIVDIVSGSSFNGALDDQGNVYTWGRHEKGQLGLGTGVSPDQNAMESVPTRVEFPEDTSEHHVRITQIAAGYKHMLCLAGSAQKDRVLYTWGNSMHTSPSRSLFPVSSSFEAVGGGDHFSVAVDDEGALASWGKGAAGCLGHGSTASLNEPLFVKGFGASPERAGVGSDASKWLGRVLLLKPGHNYCAVLARK